MPGAVDITGERYGRLLAIRKTHMRHYPSGQVRGVWLFRCDCGSEVEKTAFDVRRGDTKSCGCFKPKVQPGNTLPAGESSFRGLLQKYKRASKSRGYSWSLTEDHFRRLTQGVCTYCGTPPSQQAMAHRSSFGPYTYNGIDRVLNEVGYEPENVVSCCQTCNRAKGVMPPTEFLEWVDRVHSHQAQRRKALVT